MGADQIAAIHPLIVEIEEAPEGEEWCASFEVPQSDHWVQVVPGTVNFSYPYADCPAERLEHLGIFSNRLQLDDWKPGKYAAFTYAPLPNREIARLVDRIFVTLLGCDDDTYQLDVSLERL